MPDACDRYQAFVVTPSGNTPQDPTGIIPSQVDYAEWLDTADRFIALVEQNTEKAFVALGALPPELGYAEQLRARFDSLPGRFSPVLVTGLGGYIGQARDLAVDAACNLGQLEDAMAALEVQAVIPLDPGSKPTPLPSAGEAVSAIGRGLFILAALYLLTMTLGRDD